MFFKQGVHRFQREPQVAFVPVLPAAGLILESFVVVPFAFDFCLYRKLLELLEGRQRAVTRIQEDDGRAELIHKVHQRPFVVGDRVLHWGRPNHIACPGSQAWIRRRGNSVNDSVQADGRFESCFVTDESSRSKKPAGAGAEDAEPLRVDEALGRQPIQSEERVSNIMIAAVAEHQLTIISTAPAGAANVRSKHEVSLAREELYEGIPRSGMLAVNGIAENEQGGMAGPRFGASWLEDECGDFLTVEAAVLQRFRPDKTSFAAQLWWHHISQLNRPRTVEFGHPNVRNPARVRVSERETRAIGRPLHEAARARILIFKSAVHSIAIGNTSRPSIFHGRNKYVKESVLVAEMSDVLSVRRPLWREEIHVPRGQRAAGSGLGVQNIDVAVAGFLRSVGDVARVRSPTGRRISKTGCSCSQQVRDASGRGDDEDVLVFPSIVARLQRVRHKSQGLSIRRPLKIRGGYFRQRTHCPILEIVAENPAASARGFRKCQLFARGGPRRIRFISR